MSIIKQLEDWQKDPKPVHRGYNYAQLKQAFDSVSDPQDWKGPIAAVMGGEAVNVVVAAIQFFTATEPKVSYNPKTGQFVVESIGYRAGPAGDH